MNGCLSARLPVAEGAFGSFEGSAFAVMGRASAAQLEHGATLRSISVQTPPGLVTGTRAQKEI